MSFSDILELLDRSSALAWLIAAIVSFFVWKYTKASGWAVVLTGAGFAVLRQVWELIPGYGEAKSSEALFNLYMMRYVWGQIGAFLLIIGLIMLLVNYYIVKTRLE